MKLIMHILKKNEKLNIDNRKVEFGKISNKLLEECTEVMVAIDKYIENKTLNNLKEIIRETFDVIQMCILILWRCKIKSETLDEPNLISEINLEHKDKLISERAWIPETGILIDIKE